MSTFLALAAIALSGLGLTSLAVRRGPLRWALAPLVGLGAWSLARAGPAFRDAFSPELLFWAHQDYPILLPGVVAQGFLLAGAQPRWIPAAVAFAFAALAVAVLAGALERLRPGGSGLLA